MVQVPSNLIPSTISQLQEAPVASENSLLLIVYNGVNYKIRAGDLLSVAGVPTSRQVIAGTGLTGGGQLSSNVTLSVAPKGINGTLLADTGVTPGVYGDTTNIPVFTVDSTGRVTAATTIPVSVSGYVPTTRQVIAGTGLSGGGALSSNVTLTANLSDATPLVRDTTGSAGVSNDMSRADHQHPAVDLSDDDQVDNILGLNNGGTARSLVMQPGAVIWSGADGLYVGPAGSVGQVLVSGGTGAPTWGTSLIVAPIPANYVFVGPTSGPNADPTFRLLVNDDLPATISGKTLSNNTITGGTINSATIGATTPSTGTFTQVDVDNLRLDGNTIASTNANGNIVLDPNGTGVVDVPAPITNVDYLQFDTTATVTDATGRLYYANADQLQTLTFQMNGSVIQHIGESQFYRIKCSGSVTQGQVVMFAGTLGASGGLIGAAATGLNPLQADRILGLAAESGVNNDWITVCAFGEVKQLNTTGGAEVWAQGDELYYNPLVTGGLTKTKPIAPAAIVKVAAVVHVGVSNGILFVRPTFGSVLGGTDGNVNFTSLASGNTLIYDAVAGVWENANLTDGTGISITEGAGSITITNSAPDQVVSLAAGTGISTTGTYPSFTITNTAPDQVVSLSAGAGISTSGTYPNFTITNSAPDQVVSLTAGTNISVSGSYPSFTIANTMPSSLTIGTTSISLGGTSLTLGGLTSVAVTQDPVSALQLATKQYVDAVAEGLHVHASCAAATTGTLASITGGSVTYNNGTAGVGATLTLGVALTVLDGYTLQNGDRVLVKNEATQANNGIYTWATGGTVLTRATDFDTTTEIASGDFTFVSNGTLYADTGWVQTNSVTTVGTSSIVFVQFSGAGTYTAGTGLTLSGTQFSITNTGVSAATYGSASSVPTIAVNAQGQITSASNTSIAIDASQVTSGTVDAARLSGSYTGITGVGTLTAGTWNASTIGVAYGGTGLTAGTSGGVPYYSATNTLASSGVLAANALVVGGGAGAAPATIATGSGVISAAGNAVNTGGGLVTQSGTLAASSLLLGGGANTAISSTATGTGVVTALGINIGTAGAFVVNGGALGTPASGTVTNLTGTASININGTVGATTPTTGAFTTISASGVITSTVSTGTAPFTVASTTQVANLNAATAGTATNAVNFAVTDDTTTNATMYPVWVTANTGNLPARVTSTKLSFNPSTGALTATGGIGGGTF